MVEAAVVVKLALDTASALTAKLQLKFPTLRSAKDMFNIARNISQKSFRQSILLLHRASWTSSGLRLTLEPEGFGCRCSVPRREVSVGSEAYKKRKAFLLSDVSKIFRLMRLNDKFVLSGGSWKGMLEATSDVCSKELCATRVLSHDLLKLNEDLVDTFPDLIKVVGRQDDFKDTP
ncbi:uncharacterized protein IUM83_18850 [Phytophthora cinnamomi]|uniref:uncharacterized protein n=1 Tax=Phytophthora cinnamomi TaxID=4785 RepID=UPI00355A11B0|nr:hypothetical protein IUM83_18850 [Phytophthora cinnamomi]